MCVFVVDPQLYVVVDRTELKTCLQHVEELEAERDLVQRQLLTNSDNM